MGDSIPSRSLSLVMVLANIRPSDSLINIAKLNECICSESACCSGSPPKPKPPPKEKKPKKEKEKKTKDKEAKEGKDGKEGKDKKDGKKEAKSKDKGKDKEEKDKASKEAKKQSQFQVSGALHNTISLSHFTQHIHLFVFNIIPHSLVAFACRPVLVNHIFVLLISIIYVICLI